MSSTYLFVFYHFMNFNNLFYDDKTYNTNLVVVMI